MSSTHSATSTAAGPLGNAPTVAARNLYLEQVIDAAKLRGVEWPTTDPTALRTAAIYDGYYLSSSGRTDSSGSRLISNVDHIINEASINRAAGRHSVCIIQNITPVVVAYLGAAWNIDPAFFAEHCRSRKIQSIRKDSNDWTKVENLQLADDRVKSLGFEKHCHIDAIIKYHPVKPTSGAGSTLRLPNDNFFHRDQLDLTDLKWPLQAPWCATRLSYYRVHEYLYLVLVDAPFGEIAWSSSAIVRPRTSLWLPYSSNSDGLVLPQLYSSDGRLDLLKYFSTFLQESWHLDYLFAPRSVILPHPLLYMLASSTWQANLAFLDRTIKHISFVEIRNPDRGTNGNLHDVREYLNELKKGVASTYTWSHKDIRSYFEMPDLRRNDIGLRTPMPFHRLLNIQAEAKELEVFLMETFQLLMSSLSVHDSQISIEQARHWTIITRLAFIYVPLSFVTGIFGMNIKEINGSPISYWVCLAALGVVVAATIVGFILYRVVNAVRRASIPTGFDVIGIVATVAAIISAYQDSGSLIWKIKRSRREREKAVGDDAV